MKKILALALILVSILIPFASCGGGADLDALFLSVGKADCILLRVGDETILVDTGYDENYTTIKSTLTKEGVGHIDHMILTHFDKDHIGSAEELLTTCTVGCVYMPAYNGTGGIYTNLAAFFATYRGEVKRVTERLALTLGDFSMVIDPTALTSLGDEDDNNHSLIVSLRHSGFSMLLMGDAEKARVVDYATRDTATYNIVKLPHHGDYFKDLAWYLDTAKPSHAIHSCEAGGVDEKLSEALNARSINQFITADGNIRVTYSISSGTYSVTQE